METWYIIVLAVIAVFAVAILLLFSLVGDDAIRLHRMRHRRGEYINDQTAVICQSIKDTEDPAKAYHLFLEYLFANNRHFLSFVRNKIRSTYELYLDHNIVGLNKEIDAIKEMRVELKDQAYTQKDCMASLQPEYYADCAIWVRISTNCRFDINQSLRQITIWASEYFKYNNEPVGENYQKVIEQIVSEIEIICKKTSDLLQSGNIEGMRELRRYCNDVLKMSEEQTQRLYDVLNDGHSSISEEKRLAMTYILNNMRECHNIVQTLRRLLLCHISKVLTVTSNQ